MPVFSRGFLAKKVSEVLLGLFHDPLKVLKSQKSHKSHSKVPMSSSPPRHRYNTRSKPKISDSIDDNDNNNGSTTTSTSHYLLSEQQHPEYQ